MEKEVKDLEQGTIQDEPSITDQLNELKVNYVPKEKYEKVVNEKNELMDYIKSGQADKEQEAVVLRTAAEIRDELFGDKSDDQTNLEKNKLILELRDATIREYGFDPFVGKNCKDPDVKKQAENVAAGLQYCIDQADGNPEVFNATLASIMQDSPRRR